MIAPEWKVIGASVAGTSHEAAGKPCEDASAWWWQQDLTCLAVADGAGSRPLSRQGAALAVEQALLLARACASRSDAGDPGAWLRLVFQGTCEQVAALASAEGNDAGDYAATLAVAVVTSDVVCIGQLGDTIAVTGHGGRYKTVAPAPRSEYVNETTFLTEHDALDHVRVTLMPAPGVDAVFLSTDGLRYKILSDLAAAAPFTPFFEDATAYVCSPEASTDAVRRFLTGLDDQSGDDKTLVAAVRTRPSAGPQDSGPQDRAAGQPSAGHLTMRVSPS